MALLAHPNGTHADVPDDLVDRFVSLGWRKQRDKEKQAPQKRADSRKKSE